MKLLKKIIKGLTFRIESRLLSAYAVFDYLRTNGNIHTNPSICGFYQCYKLPKSVFAALTSFRSVYPDSTVHMFCDNGLDFSHVAEHFGCKYEYLSNATGKGDTLFFLTKDKVLAYMNRLLYTAQNSHEDFIMILEDDLRVYKKIKKLKFDWNCIKADHHFSGRKLTTFLRARNKSIPWYVGNMYFTGCGGAMVNRAFIIEHFSDEEKLKAAISETGDLMKEQWNGAMPQDAILTALILYFGGTVGWYPGFTEARYWRYYLRRFTNPSIYVVHNDKSMYNIPLSSEENKIFLGEK